MKFKSIVVTLLMASAQVAVAQTDATRPAGERPTGNRPAGEPQIPRGGGVQLGPDDKPAFPDPPFGFNIYREGVKRGKLEFVEYDSKSVGTKRRMQVYTPPGYSKDQKYPVLYLMHGIGGDDTEWQRYAHLDVVMDNLIADKKAVPMIVVMPNGRAQKDDRAQGNIYAAAPAFEAFEQDLVGSVIPTIDGQFGTQADAEHRALAGLSMGGGQTFNFGFGHPELFGWLGAFSAAPNTRQPAQLAKNPDDLKKYKLIFIACGSLDGLIRNSRGVHEYLQQQNVPHVYHVAKHGHDPAEWSDAFYYFAQKLFTDAKP